MNQGISLHQTLPPDADVRLEVWAANLAAQNTSVLEQLVVHCSGIFKRGYAKDILQVTFLKDGDNIDKIHIETSRESLYDALPDGLFHQQVVSRPQPFKEAEQMLAESRRLREEEQAARYFFLPFEQAFYRKRIRLEQEERACLFDSTDGLKNWFQLFRDSAPELSESQQVRFFQLLPVASRLAGKAEKLGAVYQAVLGEPVNMQWGNSPLIGAEKQNTPCLGEVTLGSDFVCGDHFQHELPGVEITVGPLSVGGMNKFLPGGNGYRVVECLNRYLLPVEYEVSVNVIPNQAITAFELGNDTATARLGWNTVI